MNNLPDMPLPQGTITMLRAPEGGGFHGWLHDLDLLPEMPLDKKILVSKSSANEDEFARTASTPGDSRQNASNTESFLPVRTTNGPAGGSQSATGTAKAALEPADLHAWWIMATSAVLVVWLLLEALF